MPPSSNSKEPVWQVSDAELLQVMADFLAMGHVENIVSMCRQEPLYLSWAGQLLADERYGVRLGVSVLFEYLREELSPETLALAIPGLSAQLTNPIDWIRGEAASVLAIIGSPGAMACLAALLDDPSPQVSEIVRDILAASPHGTHLRS